MTVLALALAACNQRAASRGGRSLVEVAASGRNRAGRHRNAEDAADDAAIWRNAAKPEASLIVATDKKAGLYVYGLDGKVRDFDADGRLNNVDLVDMGAAGVIVVASDRNDEAAAKLPLYRLDTAGGEARSRWARSQAARAKPTASALLARARRPARRSRCSRRGTISEIPASRWKAARRRASCCAA